MIERWEVEPLHRPRRGFDERLLMAAPWLLRLLAWRVFRSPPGSRSRRNLFERAIQIGIAQTNRRDREAISVSLDPSVELFMYPDVPESRPAGMEPVYRGDKYMRALDDWEAAFEENRWDLREFVDAGGNRIGARAELVGLGAGSGIETRMAQFLVWQFERGLLRRQWVFESEAAMLAVLAEA